MKPKSPNFVLYQGSFVYLGSLEIPYEAQDGFFHFCQKKKTKIGTLIGTVLNL